MEPEFKNILLDWASSKPFIVRLWVFGSRARGTHRPDSDLDVAVQVESRRRHESAYTLFVCEHQSWQADLQSQFTVKIHLCHYDLDCDPDLAESEGNVVKSVQAGSILIWDSTVSPIGIP